MIRRALLLNFRVLHRVDGWVQRRFTQAGLVVLGAMVASGVFGIDTSSTMAAQIFTASVALVSLALLCSLRLKTRLDARRDAPKYATVGEPVTYRMILENNGDRSLTGIWVEEQVKERIPAHREFMRASEPGRQHRNLFDRHVGYPRWAWLMKRGRGAVTHECEAPSIPACGAVSVDVSLTPIRRGYVRLTGVDILRREPFGLCKARQSVGGTQSILVLPKRYPVRWPVDAGARVSMTGSSNTERTMGGSEDFSTVREYRSRDPLRRIHWPSSARLGQLIVKEFHQPSDSRISLILDTFSVDSTGQQLEEAVSVAASFAHNPNLARQAVDTLFTVNEIVRIETGRGASGAVRMLGTLACIERCTDQSFDALSDAVENHAGVINSVVAVLLEWDEERQRMIRALQDRDIPVLVMLVTQPGAEFDVEPGVMLGHPGKFHVIPTGDAEQCLSRLGT